MSGSVEVTWMGGGGECSAREVDLAGCELRLTGVETAAADELFNDKCDHPRHRPCTRVRRDCCILVVDRVWMMLLL